MFLNCIVPVLLIIEITCWALLPNLRATCYIKPKLRGYALDRGVKM